MQSVTGRLYAHYQEFYRSDRILIDHQAARAFPEILKDCPQLKTLPLSQRVSQLTSVIRSRWFDQKVMAFLTANPEAIVVNLGSRLCTRYWRLPMLYDNWYEVDCPEVMELRQRYFTIVSRDLDIDCDCMDFSWIHRIQRNEGQPMLFLLEGVCMYLKPEENQALFEAIAQAFGPVHVLFDGVSSRFIDHQANGILSQPEDFLGEWGTQFRWGINDLTDLAPWAIRPQLIQKIEYLRDMLAYPERLEPWMTTFWPMLEPLLQDSGQIYHLYLE